MLASLSGWGWVEEIDRKNLLREGAVSFVSFKYICIGPGHRLPQELLQISPLSSLTLIKAPCKLFQTLSCDIRQSIAVQPLFLGHGGFLTILAVVYFVRYQLIKTDWSFVDIRICRDVESVGQSLSMIKDRVQEGACAGRGEIRIWEI